MTEHEEKDEGDSRRGERVALMMRLSGLSFAVYLEECEGETTTWAEPSPLPHAPASVLGVVSVRGRMLTLIDAARLFESLGLGFERRPVEFNLQIAPLRGDEQLALLFESCRPVPFMPDYLQPPPESSPPLILATFLRYGETVYLLDAARLFDAAMSGTERRRQRAVNREP